MPDTVPLSPSTLLRRCTAAGVVLVFAVIVASAYLRLAQAGLGCADWPACYGATARLAGPGEEQSWLIHAMRLTHRIAAAGVGFVVIAIAVLCFGAARRHFGRMLIAGALVAFTIFLALLGRATPGAQLPAVTLGNLLGGMMMLGLMEWLRLHAAAVPRVPSHGGHGPWIWVGAALIAAQIALGALLSANYATPSCATFPDCHGQWWPSQAAVAMLDPWRVPEALPAAILIADPARQGLHLMHRMGAFIVLIYWMTLAAITLRNRSNGASAVALTGAVLIVQFAAGIATVLFELPLAMAVAHNALAALLVLATANAAFQSRSAEEASVSASCQMVTSK